MELFLGVDGGGTKTTFVVIDRSGAVRAHHQAGCTYYPEVGVEGVRETMRAGCETVLGAAGITAGELAYAYFAVPAYGEDSAVLASLDELPARIVPQGRYRCGNDMVPGWAGAFACGDGINIVSGTGSIAYGEYRGRSARAGGWGELFSDEGSAYWIAREGLNLFSRMSDGRLAEGPLLHLVRRRLQLARDLDLCAVVYNEAGGLRSQVARLAHLVGEAAGLGDPRAQDVFVRAAQELADIVRAVRGALAVPPAAVLPVSYSGGMFQATATLLEPFRAALLAGGAPFELVAPRFPPWAGAALYEAICGGTMLEAQALARLTRECTARAARGETT